MAWKAVYAIYNEAKFLERSIMNIIDEMDKIIIVEGCWKSGEKITKSLRSTDGTLEILDRLDKTYPNKFEIIHANGENEQRHRDNYLTKLEDGDNVLWIDGDELLLPKELREAKVYAEQMFKMGYQMLFSHYINVFDTGAVVDSHLRGLFFKFRNDIRYLDNERAKISPGEVYLFENYGKGGLYNKSMPVIPWEIIKVFHFKYCKDLDKLVERRLMYESVWSNVPDDKLEETRKSLEEEYRTKFKSGLKRENIYEGEVPC